MIFSQIIHAVKSVDKQKMITCVHGQQTTFMRTEIWSTYLCRLLAMSRSWALARKTGHMVYFLDLMHRQFKFWTCTKFKVGITQMELLLIPAG